MSDPVKYPYVLKVQVGNTTHTVLLKTQQQGIDSIREWCDAIQGKSFTTWVIQSFTSLNFPNAIRLDAIVSMWVENNTKSETEELHRLQKKFLEEQTSKDNWETGSQDE